MATTTKKIIAMTAIVLVVIACLGYCGRAHAGTVYLLPDPAFAVAPNYGNNTTLVTFAGVTYRGPSQFQYYSECAQPDSARYHCNVEQETSVDLYSPLGARITVTLTAQFAAVLNTSGHNYWRQSQIVVTPSTVTLP